MGPHERSCALVASGGQGSGQGPSCKWQGLHWIGMPFLWCTKRLSAPGRLSSSGLVFLAFLQRTELWLDRSAEGRGFILCLAAALRHGRHGQPPRSHVTLGHRRSGTTALQENTAPLFGMLGTEQAQPSGRFATNRHWHCGRHEGFCWQATDARVPQQKAKATWQPPRETMPQNESFSQYLSPSGRWEEHAE